MAGMKRFVTYIYAYEEEKKGSNVGFARIEIRGQDARIEIHLRGVYAASAACRVYLFQREASGGKEATGVTGVLVGEMKLANGSGDGIVVLRRQSRSISLWHYRDGGIVFCHRRRADSDEPVARGCSV